MSAVITQSEQGVMHLPAISLEDLQAEAAFLTRRDRKYLVSMDQLAEMLGALDRDIRVLEIGGQRTFTYVTPYFDDDGYSAYLRAARRRPDRFKVRTRLYADSGLCMLEVKVRNTRGQTVKHRATHDASRLGDLTSEERAWLMTFPQVAPVAFGLEHRVTTEYRRTTLALPNAAGRVTIDLDLAFTLPCGERRRVVDHVIIETKGAGQATAIDRLLWRMGCRPSSMSKFAAGLSLLHPELPANRWHRIREHMAMALE